MKKIDIGQILNTLANLGVIAGIVFLALELRQNNQLASAQARLTRHELRSQDANRIFYENPDFAELYAKATSGGTLTNAESIQLMRFNRQAILNWQFIYTEYIEGSLTRQDVTDDHSWRRSIAEWPGMPELWADMSNRELKDEFVRFMQSGIDKP